jgi:hypothetical protein
MSHWDKSAGAYADFGDSMLLVHEENATGWLLGLLVK